MFYVTKCELEYFTEIIQRIDSSFVERVDVAELQESREPAPITAPPLDQNPQAIPSLLINAAGDVVQNQEASRPEPQVEYFKKLTRQEAVSSDVSSEGNFQNVLIFRIGKIELF